MSPAIMFFVIQSTDQISKQLLLGVTRNKLQAFCHISRPSRHDDYRARSTTLMLNILQEAAKDDTTKGRRNYHKYLSFFIKKIFHKKYIKKYKIPISHTKNLLISYSICKFYYPSSIYFTDN